jgi:tRNA dimethylallyltransferase
MQYPVEMSGGATARGPRIRLIAIVGPTAVGKTALAVQLAERFGGEVIGADSRQIYRFMDVGSAKPCAAERLRVPHHLIDIVTPDETLTLGQYKALASACIDEISNRGKLPLIVGGTGLYLKTIVEGWTIPAVAPDYAFRERLLADASAHGSAALYEKLLAVDPAAAGKVDPRNVRRVVRYLEVFHATGEPISSRQRKIEPPYDLLQIGLTLPRALLYRRIDARVDAMMSQGFLEEVRRLVDIGYDPDLPALSGFGYRQLIQHVLGRMTLADAVAETKKETRRFVRRQYAWFPLDDPNILWLNGGDGAVAQASQAVEEFVQRAFERS